MKPRYRSRLSWQAQPRLSTRLNFALSGGGWWCHDCQRQTERIEGEQGQPATCERCGSHRIEYQPPLTNQSL